MTFTENDLLSRGFTRKEWSDEGNTFTEYTRQLRHATSIEISGTTLVELVIEDAYETANIESLEELDLLIKMFE